MVMQAAEFRKCDHPTPIWRVHHPRVRCVHRYGKVRSPVMIVDEILRHDPPEMALVQSDDMIEAVPSQGSDEPLHEWVLPGTSRCANNLLDPMRRTRL